MLRTFFILLAFVAILVVVMFGMRGQKSSAPPFEIFPDMDRQPKVKAQDPSTFYADGRAARPPVPGTVPLGYDQPQERPIKGVVTESASPYDRVNFGAGMDYFNTGRMGDQWGTGIPFEVTMETMRRGQERYAINCAVCHGATGAGDGMAKQFGLNTVQSFHQDRLRTMSDGEIFNTITNGKNTMFGLGDRVQVPDRWAIIAYLRALQKSQGGATANDLPPEERAKLLSTP